MSMVPPARSTRGGAEDSIIIATCRSPIADGWIQIASRKLTISLYRLQIRSLRITRLLVISTSLLFERNVFLKLLSQILELFGRGVFEFLEALWICLFELARDPKTLGEIKADNAKNNDHQQHFSKALEVTD